MEKFVEDYNPDVQQLAETLFIGPQGDLLERIERFNNHYSRYDITLGVTGKFRWKPGSYDKVRTALNNIMGFNAKPSSVVNIIDRIQNADWNVRRIKEQLLTIERQMVEMRSSGAIWQDNSDTIVETLESSKTRISDKLDAVNINGLSMNVYYKPHPDDSDSARRYDDIVISILIKNPKISLLRSDSTNEIVGVVPYDGNIELLLRVNIMRFLNYWAGKDNWNIISLPRNIDASHYRNGNGASYSMLLNAKAMPNMLGLEHPFISRNQNFYGHNYGQDQNVISNSEAMEDYNQNTRGICLGDMYNDICKAAWSMDLVSLSMLVNMWATQYHVVRTGPLNNIKCAFHGVPEFITEEVKNTIGTIGTPSECSLPNLTMNGGRPTYRADEQFAIKYCDKSKCQLKSECQFYIRLTDEDFTNREDQARVEYVEWMLNHTSADWWPEGVANVSDALEVYREEAASGEIGPEDDLFYWDFRELRRQLGRAKDDWEKKAVLADKLQSFTGDNSDHMKVLMVRHSTGWFRDSIAEHEVNLDPSRQDETEIRRKMMEWAATMGGITANHLEERRNQSLDPSDHVDNNPF